MTESFETRLQELGSAVARQLAAGDEQLVLAESCTAGLVAATLATIPGISRHLIGSWVTYQEAAKIAWLGVEPEMLTKYTAVSEPVTRRMAEQALARTRTATLSAAVTGHLGPGAPASLDGTLFVGVQRPGQEAQIQRFQLAARSRMERQQESVAFVLAVLQQNLSPLPPGRSV